MSVADAQTLDEISIIVGEIKGLLSRADNMAKNGLDLSQQKIGSAVEGGEMID